jgi:hypothetical protein
MKEAIPDKRSQRQYLLVFGLLPVSGLVLFFWWSISSHQAKQLEAMDLEYFDETQMETWKSCQTVFARMEQLEEKVDQFGDVANNAQRQTARDIYTPRVCQFLSQQRQVARKSKIEAGK